MSSRQQNIQIETRTMAVTLERTALDVAVSVEIEAESRWVLYALTIPSTWKHGCDAGHREATVLLKLQGAKQLSYRSLFS